MTAAKTFVDSNILIYAYDADAGAKQVLAEKCLDDLWKSQTGCLSLQVLQEFYVNATRKLHTPLPHLRARQIVQRFAEWEPIRPDLEMFLRATDLVAQKRFSFWDALIIVTALESGATTLYSEDFTAGQTIQGLKIRNPLTP